MSKFRFKKELTERDRAKFSERLLRLREIILKSKSYDHSQYVDSSAEFHFKERDDMCIARPKNPCGTPACALGHAIIHKREFPGLHLTFALDEFSDVRLRPTNGEIDEIAIADGYFGPHAYASIFSSFAFNCNAEDVTFAMVASRIESFVKQSFGYEPA